MSKSSIGAPVDSLDRAVAEGVRRDDRILRETKWLVAFILPFVVLGVIILYFFPGNTAQLFAWTITPNMTALFMGAGYIAGTYFLVRLLMANKWHWFAHGVAAIAVFTWFQLASTIIHISRFNQSHPAFYVWIGLYLVAPVAVPVVWLRNRRTNPGTPDPDDAVVPEFVQWVDRLLGAALLAIGLFMFLAPDLAIGIWPWKLTQLTARVIGGWFALPGVLGLALSTDRRWSAWRVPLESQAIGIALILVGAVRSWGDFDQARVTTWVFMVGLALLLAGVVALYLFMESGRSRIGVEHEA